MTIAEALANGRIQLRASPTPQLDARLLLQHVLQVNRSYLVAHSDQPLTAVQIQQYHRLLKQAQQHVPIPYLTGQAAFYGFTFYVDTAVLIPRPETEHLVEAALAWAQSRPSLKIVDVGTGSGCIAVALAHYLPQATVAAVDISAAALAVARKNARRHTPGRIHFYQGHLLAPISYQPNLITANLPYVTDEEWTMLDDGVKLYEPASALKGGADGLDLIRQLLQQATAKLNAGGAIFLEIGWQQGPQAQQMARSYFPQAQVEIIPDYAGHDRVVAIKTE